MSRKDFYHTKVWRTQSKLFAMSKYCICERCHTPVYVDGVSDYIPKERRIKYIVHHKIPLNETNYQDENISLNWDNLELLCIDCHNKENGNQVIRNDLKFDEMGNVIPKHTPPSRFD